MASYLQRREGVYEPGKRFAFTNISETPYEIKWNSRIAAVVQPHQTILIDDTTPVPGPGNGDCIARTKTIELATRIILGEAKVDTQKLGFLTDKSYVSPVGTRAGIPEARKPYEVKILQELPPADNLELLNQMKADEITADMRRQQGVSYSSQTPEFANAPKAGEGRQEAEAVIPKANADVFKPTVPVAPAAPVKKAGRPKKNATPSAPAVTG